MFYPVFCHLANLVRRREAGGAVSKIEGSPEGHVVLGCSWRVTLVSANTHVHCTTAEHELGEQRGEVDVTSHSYMGRTQGSWDWHSHCYMHQGAGVVLATLRGKGEVELFMPRLQVCVHPTCPATCNLNCEA